MSESAESKSVPTAQEVAMSMLLPGCDHIFAVIPGPGLVTFHSQQRRAFNLLWSLAETKVIHQGSTVGIVGGGLAGITAAAASSMLGCKVTLFESGLLPFHQQRGNFTRYIHPNILDWPRVSAANAHTALPYLNWTADRCALVIREIEAQWETVRNVQIRPFQEVAGVSTRPRGARVTVDKPFDQTEYDCVIVCVGFGKEKPFGGVRVPTYWENDSLHQIDFVDGQHILVSGTGDGGLVELMRLMIVDFDHGRILETLAAHHPLQQLRDDILKAEDKARNGDPSEAGSTLLTAYKTLQIEKAFPKDFRSRIRSNARVTLNGTGDTPYQLSSSILNRVIAYVLIRWGIVEYVSGRLLTLQQTQSKTVVEFDRKPVLKKLDFDNVVIRHGPVGQLAKLFGPDVAEEFRKPARRISAVGGVELWPRRFFGKQPALSNEYLKLTQLRAARFSPSFQEIVRKRWGAEASVKIGFDAGHATYIVDIAKTASVANAPSEFARTPIIYERSNEVRISSNTRTSTSRYRPLACGIGIQNYDLMSREGSLSSGTLGCFVETPDRRPAFLSALHVLAGDKPPNIGDLIVQAPESTNPKVDGIARLHTFVPIQTVDSGASLRDASKANFCDVGLAALLPEIEFVPTFLPDHQLPLPKSVADLEVMASGDEVWIVGASSGPKRAIISAIAVTMFISLGDKRAIFRDCIELRPIPESRFLQLNAPREPGSLVIYDDGSIAGMTFAGNSNVTLAFTVRKALELLDCKLITFTR